MAIKKIVIDPRTKTTKIDAGRVQLDIVAFPMNEQNQREPWAELRLYVNNSLVKIFISDATGTVQESLIVSAGSLKLKDVMSHVECDVFDVLQGGWWSNNEKQQIIAKIKIYPNYITGLDQESKNDSEIVKYALEQNGLLLQYAGENIRNDKKMVMLAMDHSPQAFNYASDILKTDEEFVVECLKKYWIQIANFLSTYILNRPNIKKEISNEENEIQISSGSHNTFVIEQEISKIKVIEKTQNDLKIEECENKIRQFKKIYDTIIENQKKINNLYRERTEDSWIFGFFSKEKIRKKKKSIKKTDELIKETEQLWKMFNIMWVRWFPNHSFGYANDGAFLDRNKNLNGNIQKEIQNLEIELKNLKNNKY